MRRATTCLLAVLLGLGCSTDRNPGDLLAPGEIGVIVVDAQLIVGEPMPQILLRTTQSPDRPYDSFNARLNGASVEVVASTGDTIRYVNHAIGGYRPESAFPGPAPDVLPNTTYALRVVAPDGRVVTARTTTPDSFRVRDWVLLDDPTLVVRRRLATREDFPGDPDSVYTADSNQLIYQDGLLEARFDRGNAIGYQVGLFSRECCSPLVIDADFLSEEDKADLDRESSSPPFVADESSIRLPWFAIFFEGRYDIRIYMVDRNWYDLARSLQFLGDSNIAFGSNAGDDFERPIFHVEGGIGLFGSAARDEIGFTIHPRP
jgi:hypothetical protein